MPHVLVAGKLHPKGREVLNAAPGLTVQFIDEISEESYAPHIEDADALLIRTQPMSAATVDRARRLKIVSRHGVGYDAVDVKALSARGIPLAVCGDVNSASVAEHAMMMILATAKQAIRSDKSVRQGAWEWRNRLEQRDVAGRNLLIVGYGRIGRRIGDLATAFGLSIRAFDPFIDPGDWPEGTVRSVAHLPEGLQWADIVVLSLPKADAALIGAQELDSMKDGAVLVNPARGGLVDEYALVEALRSGKIAAAGLDVFEDEPLQRDHPITQFDNVILSPHIAGLTLDAAERLAVSSAENVVDFFAGRLDPARIVNLQV